MFNRKLTHKLKLLFLHIDAMRLSPRWGSGDYVAKINAFLTLAKMEKLL